MTDTKGFKVSDKVKLIDNESNREFLQKDCCLSFDKIYTVTQITGGKGSGTLAPLIGLEGLHNGRPEYFDWRFELASEFSASASADRVTLAEEKEEAVDLSTFDFPTGTLLRPTWWDERFPGRYGRVKSESHGWNRIIEWFDPATEDMIDTIWSIFSLRKEITVLTEVPEWNRKEETVTVDRWVVGVKVKTGSLRGEIVEVLPDGRRVIRWGSSYSSRWTTSWKPESMDKELTLIEESTVTPNPDALTEASLDLVTALNKIDELEAFKAKVVEYVLDKMADGDICADGTKEFFEEMGMMDLFPQQFNIKVELTIPWEAVHSAGVKAEAAVTKLKIEKILNDNPHDIEYWVTKFETEDVNA